MQLNQVTYFLRLCDTLNFTRAAELCHVSQPSLSAGIKKLEDELGGALFVRQGRSIELTELGEAMRIHLSAIEQAKNAASLIASGITQSEAHRINLGFMCTLSPDRLMEAIATFSQDNSSSELLVHDVWASNALDLLTAESLDCIIMAHTSSLPEQFVQHTLSKEPMMLAMSASNPLSEQDQIGFEDLNNHAYVDRLRCEFREVFFKELGQRKLNVQVVMRSEREDLVRDSVSEGVGVSIMPRSAAEKANLKTAVLNDMQIERTISIVTVRDRLVHPSMQKLINMICSAYNIDC